MPNKHVKTIVNTAYVVKSRGDPHSFIYTKGHHAVNTDFQKVAGPFNENPTYTGWHINHYVIKVLNSLSLYNNSFLLKFLRTQYSS
jgi:hypothetical protein